MNANVFVSTTGKKLSRAVRVESGDWRVETLLEGQHVNCLCGDPHNSNTVYAGTDRSGILHSTDRGKTWQPLGFEGQAVKAIAVSPIVAGLICLGTKPPLVFVSRDGGHHWVELASFRRMRRWWWFSPVGADIRPYIQSITLSPSDPEVMLVGVEACGVFRSSDSGSTWTGHINGSVRDCHTLTFHNTDSTWVYEAGGTGAGIALSRDAGINWSQPADGLDLHYGWACAADPGRPDVWYASLSPMGKFPNLTPLAHLDGESRAHIFRRRGDSAWEKLGGGLPQPLDDMPYALLTDPDAPGHLYAGLSNGDVWHTADCGDQWQQLPFNLGAINRALIMM